MFFMSTAAVAYEIFPEGAFWGVLFLDPLRDQEQLPANDDETEEHPKQGAEQLILIFFHAIFIIDKYIAVLFHGFDMVMGHIAADDPEAVSRLDLREDDLGIDAFQRIKITPSIHDFR